MGDPSPVKIPLLRGNDFSVHQTAVHPAWIKSHETGDGEKAGLGFG
jgi:hypothetical protein